ncbi:Uu.00g047650.m01.CDS01 [Anthostomella pinea]|uniref:Uu.00g047650.m01.CDS01 n=1 Tax=Anthostomella pinea TaxID=933095 RepID=A0AAI8VC97_9PEZI|nr:Uu.00g047650.m01.CDS01 [Anthostomella pinea]
MQTRKQIVAAALVAFLGAADAHMIMKNPKPFGNPDNSPLTTSNYPCKLSGDPATFYNKAGIDNTMAIGEKQTLEFTGSAVHGGGSCQLAITTDKAPSVSTSWQVILSIEGGCPAKDGTSPSTYDFEIPSSVAAGDYIFAWTWMSKLAGQPEYYMNCAPITLTGGTAKRSANETMDLFPRDGDLPELFVANLAQINDCKTAQSSDTEFPNPGSVVQKPNAAAKFAPVTGSNCVPKGAKEAAPASGGSDSGSSASSTSSATQAASSTTTATQAATGFVTSTTSAATTSVADATSATSATEVPSQTASTPASGSSSAPASGLTGGMSGACTSEGMFNCVGGSTYQQCASGSWTALQAMPATTKCQEGQTMTLWGRDETPRRSFRLRR